MKKLLLSLLLITLPFSVDAQMKDTLNQELNQDILKAKKLKTAGILMTISGASLLTIGVIRLANSPKECEPVEHQGNRCHVTEWHGRGLTLSGLGTMAVGLPVWGVAIQKEKTGKINWFEFKFTSVNGIGLKITF